MNLSKLLETVKDKEAWPAAIHEVSKVGYDLATEQQQQGSLTCNKMIILLTAKDVFLFKLVLKALESCRDIRVWESQILEMKEIGGKPDI